MPGNSLALHTDIIICDPPFIVPDNIGRAWIDHVSVAKRALAAMMRPTDSTLDGGEVPVPAASGALTQALAPPKPKRIRRPSLTTIVKQALKAGADRVIVDGVVIVLSPSAAVPAEPDGNEFDAWMAKHAH